LDVYRWCWQILSIVLGLKMEDKEITLTLTVKEVDAILGAISKQPLSEVIDLFNKIRVQGIAQITPKQAEVKDE
jgi:hypothetical protein